MKRRRMDFYFADWITGVRVLKGGPERSVYIDIIALIGDRNGPIIRDDKELARYCRLKKNVFTKALERLISAGKVHQECRDNAVILHQQRVESELIRAQQRSESGSNNIAKRWKNKVSQDTDVLPRPNTRARDNHQSSYNNHQTREGIRSLPDGNGVADPSRSPANIAYAIPCKLCDHVSSSAQEHVDHSRNAHPIGAPQ
jgi:hypothetical protein